MKKHINLWLVMFLAISLALPIYSMAQTNPNPTLTLESYTTGDRIKGAPIQSFALGPDGNLVVYLGGPFIFASLVPDITVDGTYTIPGVTVSPPASVSATQGATLSFRINSTTPGASFSGGVESKPGLVVDPEPGAATSFAITTATAPNTATGIFTWTTGGTAPVPVGAYLAVFQAQATDTSGTHTSHLIVMININPPGYTLTINATNGTVTKSPDKATYNLSPVETVTLTAVPASGYSFSGWSGALSGSTSPASITMDANKSVTATFTQTPATQYTVTTTASPAQAAATLTGAGSYNAGASVTVATTAASGYTFTNWTEGTTPVSTSASYNFIISGSRSLVANFTSTTPQQYTVTTAASPTGAAATLTGAGSYNAGASVTVATTAASGYTFSNWTEGTGVTPVSNSATYNFTITGNRTLVANFTSSGGGGGGGTIAIPPNTPLLPLGVRNTMSFNPGDTSYILRIPAQTPILRIEITGLTNDTNLSWSVTYPNGYNPGTGVTIGDSITNPFRIYNPLAGDYWFKIHANAPSMVVLWVHLDQ